MAEKSKKSGRKTGLTKRKVGLREKVLIGGEKIAGHFSENFIGRLDTVKSVRLWVFEWLLLLLLVFILTIVQISWYRQSYEVSTYGRGGNYSEGALGVVSSLNPLYATTDSEKILARLLFANLVSPDENGTEKGELAKSVVMEDEGKNWILTLHENLKWSDGEAITADDVVFTVELIADSAAKTTVAADFSRVKLEKIDDLTVRFTLPSIYVDFMDNLEFPLIPEHILGEVSHALVYENSYSLNPVSSGAFMFNSMQQGVATDEYSQIVYLSRNESYFKTKTKLDGFTLKIYESEERLASALRTGGVRATASLGREAIDTSNSNELALRSSSVNAGVFAFLNMQRLNDVNLRRAIVQGVNKEVLREGLSEADVLDYPILSSQEPNLEYPVLLEYDFEAAKQKLIDLGYEYEGENLKKDGESQTLRIAATRNGRLEKSATAFAEELKKLGFAIELNIVDERQAGVNFFVNVVQAKDFDILIYEIDLGVSADPFVYYSSTQIESGWNFSGYNNSLVDDALLSARITNNSTMRTRKYDTFLENWANDVPSMGIYRSSFDYYYVKGSRIFSENRLMTDVYDRFYDVKDWMIESTVKMVTP